MRLRYNAPVVITFAVLCVAVLLLAKVLGPDFLKAFTAPGRGGFSARDPFDWVALFLHPLGHATWEHLLGNLSIILLVGPMLEEKHGSGAMVLMMLITALVTGILNVLFFSSGLVGSSGIAFMMILLSSFVNRASGEIPVSFILVALLFLGREIAGDGAVGVSHFAHLVGGALGALFGFLRHK